MASKKTTPKKATPEKVAATKKTASSKTKKQSASKAASKKTAPSKSAGAKKPGRPAKSTSQKQQTPKPASAPKINKTSTSGSASTVVITPSGFAPTALPSNVSISFATGSVPPESIQKQIASSAVGKTPIRKTKKKGVLRRFFGIFKRSK